MAEENTSGWNKLKNWFKAEEEPGRDLVIKNCYFKSQAEVAGETLVLNGAGLRSIEGEEIYSVGLYLPTKTTRADTAKALLGARRVTLYILKDLVPADFSPSLRNGIQMNTNETSQEFIKEEQAQIEELMERIGSFAAGDKVDIDWLPRKGTSVKVNGKVVKDRIRGKAIYDAIMFIWLGNHALEASLKDSLLHV